MLSKRSFMRAAAGAVGVAGAWGAAGLAPAWARPAAAGNLGLPALAGTRFDLTVSAFPVRIDGRAAQAVGVNGSVPGPLIRLREGDEVTLNVTNALAQDTSVHWHGLLVPFHMDGVPGVSFPGIAPGETFEYRFAVRQNGTYWYHSHSGLQEQIGHYGPLIIDPQDADPVVHDREYVLMLGDWTFADPHRIFAKLKKDADSLNFQQRTAGDLLRDLERRGLGATLADRAMWGKMRMSPRDLADVGGETYTYVVNGHSTDDHFDMRFAPGERVRLRIVNASAMTLFNVRLPGLPMTVVQADGQDLRPVETDEFQIGVAETYDVVVAPARPGAYAFVAESSDRSGQVVATLASAPGLRAAAPALRPVPLLGMRDMGMGSRLNEPGTGLEDVPHRALRYADLRSLAPNPDARRPGRELVLHLTGNMERYMWSFDGVRFAQVERPIVLHEGERVRLTLVNNTMMPHPIHLHGMFFELVNGAGRHEPRKHTVVVKPGERLSVDVSAEHVGDWAFHCHMLYHMHAGMFQVVSVRPAEGDAS